jgi:nucleoside transporter
MDARPSAIGPRLSAMMFLEFFIWGSWYVSMTGWMGAQKIGGLGAWAYTVGPIAAVISPFFLGMVADRFFATQRILGALHLIGAGAMVAIPSAVAWANQPVPTASEAFFTHPYILLLLLHMLCFMPTLGLTASLCFHHMTSPEKQFPIVRVFGTIGWVVGNIAVGGKLSLPAFLGGATLTWIPDGANSPAQFYITAAAGLALALYSFALPHTPPPARGSRVSIGRILGLDSLALLARPSYLAFIICSFLICIPLAGYYSNAFLFVSSMAGENDNPMLTMSCGQLSEVFFMLLMPLAFARLGIKRMLAIGMLAWAARYGLFAGAADTRTFWMVFLGVVLHGICYDFFFVAGSIHVDREAPPHIRAQAQGFLVLITQGLGLGVGAQLFGRLVAHYTPEGGAPDWKMVWLWPAAFAAAVMLAFIAFFRAPKRI